MIARISIYKGLVFIVLTSGLLYILIDRYRKQVATYVTERLQAEDKLRKSEERMRLFFEHQVVGMAITSPEKGWIQVNDKLCEMLGYDRGELAGLTWVELTHPDDLAQDTASFNRLLSGEIDSYSIKKRFIRKDGTIVYTELSVGCVRREDGAVDFLLALLNDITEQTQAEEALRLSEQRYQLLTSITSDYVYSCSRRGSEPFLMNWMAGAVETITGYSMEEIFRMGCWLNIVHPEERERVQAYLMGLEPGTRASTKFRIITKGGEIRWIYESSYCQSGENQGELILYGSSQDVTDREQLQDQLLKNQNLESLGILAGGIAHDFNNLLTGIMGNISFARKFIDATQRPYTPLLTAEKATWRAAELVRQLLTFARGGEPAIHVIAVQPLVNEAVTLMLSGSNVKGAVDIPDSIHAIKADEGQISQLFHNLIINAAHAMPDGGVLTISARNEILQDSNPLALAAGTYVRIMFRDEGCGIPAADLKRIFDPFFTTKSGGSGLGLASAHSIVHRHGGNITVSSLTGTGTTFTIYLPSTGTTYPQHQTGSDSQAAGGRDGGSLLVMDDEEIIRDLTSEMLTYLGYQVTTCSNGTEAVTLYKAGWESGTPFSAVIMDLTIPGEMGGKEAAQQIRAIDPQACLIVSSGYSEDPILADYGMSGFNGAITKPYTLDELGRVVGSLLTAR